MGSQLVDNTLRSNQYPGQSEILEAQRRAMDAGRLHEARDLWEIDRAFLIQLRNPKSWDRTAPEVRAAAEHYRTSGHELWPDIPSVPEVRHQRRVRLGKSLSVALILIAAAGVSALSWDSAVKAREAQRSSDIHRESLLKVLHTMIEENMSHLSDEQRSADDSGSNQ